ncbi:MAG: hypothetical protein Aurels2KO_41400 [Aureliella sp.]
METSLHKQLKHRYASEESQTEVVFEGYRIDAIADNGELIEIQHASLGALRDKTRKLLKNTKKTLRIVKPILARKRVSTLDGPDGEVIRSRMSPKRGEIIDVFEDLVHFSSVFPLRRLILEVLLVETEEIRIDRERPSRRGKKYKTLDQRLTSVDQATELRLKSDLVRLLPYKSLPRVFDTSQLAEAIGRPRWLAQKVAYCLRETGAAKIAGKEGNSLKYSLMPIRAKTRKKPAA